MRGDVCNVKVCDQDPKLDGLWSHHESGRRGEAMTSHMLAGGGIGLKVLCGFTSARLTHVNSARQHSAVWLLGGAERVL